MRCIQMCETYRKRNPGIFSWTDQVATSEPSLHKKLETNFHSNPRPNDLDSLHFITHKKLKCHYQGWQKRKKQFGKQLYHLDSHFIEKRRMVKVNAKCEHVNEKSHRSQPCIFGIPSTPLRFVGEREGSGV